MNIYKKGKNNYKANVWRNGFAPNGIDKLGKLLLAYKKHPLLIQNAADILQYNSYGVMLGLLYIRIKNFFCFKKKYFNIRLLLKINDYLLIISGNILPTSNDVQYMQGAIKFVQTHSLEKISFFFLFFFKHLQFNQSFASYSIRSFKRQ